MPSKRLMPGEWIEKPKFKRADRNRFEGLPIPKGVIRIQDETALEFIRNLGSCEVCGRKEKPLDPHHVKSKGSGGSDSIENLLGICRFCHNDAHMGLISRERLREIAANRKVMPMIEIKENETTRGQKKEMANDVYGEKVGKSMGEGGVLG